MPRKGIGAELRKGKSFKQARQVVAKQKRRVAAKKRKRKR